jgi:hypothetical protein
MDLYPTSELPDPESTVALFDPAHRSWRLGPDLPEPFAGPIATELADGRVLLSGAGAYAPVALLFEPTNNVWSIGRAPLMARTGGAAVRLADGRVLIVGNRGCTTNDPIAEAFNPEDGTWSSVGPFPEVGGLTATALEDGRALVVEGQGGCLQDLPPGNVFLFDPARSN